MAPSAKILRPGAQKRVLKRECTCTHESINPRQAIENRKALQDKSWDTCLKTCPLKNQHRKVKAVMKINSPSSALIVMKRAPSPSRPPSPSNNSCSAQEIFCSVQESLGCTRTSPCKSPTCSRPDSTCRSPASPQFATPACSVTPSPDPTSEKICGSCGRDPKVSSCGCAKRNASPSPNPNPSPKPGACGHVPNKISPCECARRKAERMRRYAIGFVIGSLLLLLLCWNFRKSISRSLGLSDGSEDDDDLDGTEGDFGGIFGGGSNGMSRYRRNKLFKRGQICWFNLPCHYDFEEDDWTVSEVLKEHHVQRYNKLHL